MNAKFASMKISGKIASGIALFAILTAFIAGLSAIMLKEEAETIDHLVNKSAFGLERLAEMNEIKTREHQLWFEMVIENDRPDFDALLGQVREQRSRMDKQLAAVRPLLDGSELEKLNEIERDVAAYREDTDRIPAFWSAGNRDAAEDILQYDAKEEFGNLNEDLSSLVAFKRGMLEEEAIEASGDATAAIWTIALVGLFGLGIIGSLVLWIVRAQVTRPLAEMTGEMERLASGDNDITVAAADRQDEVGAIGRALIVFRDTAREKVKADKEQELVVDTLSTKLDAMAKGDLTADVTENFSGKYALLKQNFNEALASLRDLIGSVTESTSAIRNGSGEIMSASEDLARRTEANAASLEETAASLTEVEGRVKATAKAAQQTVDRADQAIATVGSGRQVAESAVQAMGRVSENAQDIDAVIEGLDKIAFQTRVLAMNAAVEAGRAGEAGRGFAVVADLVSALAMRAEEESKTAREQLTVTQTGIQSAVDAVTKVDGALAEISSGVGEVHELLGSMARDNQAQSNALTQVSAAVGDMDKATQQNAAMVEETSAAARNLSNEVNILADQAGRFKVGQAAGRAPSSGAGAARITRPAPEHPKARQHVPAAVMANGTANGRANGSANGTAHADDWTDF